MVDAVKGQTVLRRQTILRRTYFGAGLFVLIALAIAIPETLLARGTKQASTCFSKYAEPRGPESPPCADAAKLLRIPRRFPWTANRAWFRIEEHGVRLAHNEYVEAAVGKPSREALKLAAEAIEHQDAVVTNGTKRLKMAELGPSIGVPDLGREADELGDRQTLLDRGEQWFNWRVRLSTLRKALVSGDFEKAKALAKRYAVDDPYDPDIRTAVASVLCMGPDPEKGAGMLASMQSDRASRRYEGLSRDYGEVRALLTACLAKRSLPPPPIPTESTAGSADAVEQRAALRLRLADTKAAEASRTLAVATIVRLLDGGPRNPGARLGLLAALVASTSDLDPAKIIHYSKPQFDEGSFVPSTALTALEWVADHRPSAGDAEPPVILPGSTYLVAAHTIETIAAKQKEEADKPPAKDDDDPIDFDKRLKDLARIRGAFLLEAAASLTRDGAMDDALEAVDGAVSTLGLHTHERSLLRSNVYWLSGDREKALNAIELDGGSVHSGTADKHLMAVLSTQAAELAMSQGKTDIAKREATLGDEAAMKNDPALYARKRWMLAALGEVRGEPPTIETLLTPQPFPSMGFAHPNSPWRVGNQDKRSALVDQSLAPWVGLAGASPELRRAGRWAAMRARGDAPPWLAVHALLASRLLGPGEGDAEVWLDALLALDERRFSLRSYAFARAEAARMRGDMATAATWDGRFRTLCKLAAEVPHYEFTRMLDI